MNFYSLNGQLSFETVSVASDAFRCFDQSVSEWSWAFRTACRTTFKTTSRTTFKTTSRSVFKTTSRTIFRIIFKTFLPSTIRPWNSASAQLSLPVSVLSVGRISNLQLGRLRLRPPATHLPARLSTCRQALSFLLWMGRLLINLHVTSLATYLNFQMWWNYQGNLLIHLNIKLLFQNFMKIVQLKMKLHFRQIWKLRLAN